eukprot:3323176-Pleurochrysis_carterae.AAC.1
MLQLRLLQLKTTLMAARASSRAAGASHLRLEAVQGQATHPVWMLASAVPTLSLQAAAKRSIPSAMPAMKCPST